MVLAIHQHESTTGLHVSPPHPELPSQLPPPIPMGCPRALALSALLHALNLHWLSILHMTMYVSMLFSHIVPPSSSLTESKSLFPTFASPLLPCM